MSNERIPEWAKPYMVDIPEGRSGDWRVERFEISPFQSAMATAASLRSGRGVIAPGTYTKLVHEKPLPGGPPREHVVMSDTQDEIRDHFAPIREAEKRGGRVLINGLGLGMVAEAILRLPNVESVKVVEQSRDVFDLVVPTLYNRWTDARLLVVLDDATQRAVHDDECYSVVWHDIWPEISEDNLPEMDQLEAKYAGHCDWQGSWAREFCESERSKVLAMLGFDLDDPELSKDDIEEMLEFTRLVMSELADGASVPEIGSEDDR